MRRPGGRKRSSGGFERFWNRLFTYAYDADNGVTLLVNGSFFLICGIILAWLCRLVAGLGSPIFAWVAFCVLCLGEFYLIVSIFIALQTFLLARVRKRRERKSAEAARTGGAPAKPRKRGYKTHNRR